MFNVEIARAITSNTRFYIHLLSYRINEKLQSIIKHDGKNYVTYNDTDSVVGSTLIRTSQGVFKIEDLYNKVNGIIDVLGEDNYVKHVASSIKTPSVNGSLQVENKDIKYVMKHKVKKKLYKIQVKDKEVIVTEDHSIMIVRDNKLISAKPFEILSTDEVIFYK